MIVLKPGREKALIRRHPWIFSGAISRVDGKPASGETVELFSSKGQPLGRGAFSPKSQITVRMWTFDPDEKVDPLFFRRRIESALQLRTIEPKQHLRSAFRLINAESDGLPGVFADRYGDFTVCQFLTAGAEFWKDTIVALLSELSPAEGIYERSDAEVRKKEGLSQISGLLRGAEPPELVEIREGECRYLVDIRLGHKTGFYLDQSENRSVIQNYVHGAEILNGFAYTGAFAIAALAAGAKSVVNVESSEAALALARRNADHNNLNPAAMEYVAGDVFSVLRNYRDEKRQFDAVILDPPKFVQSTGNLKRASRGYKDINMLAMQLIRPGGLLFTFSCSGLLAPDLFEKIVADAALDAKKKASLLRRLGQASDHPVALNFPEGSYLKGLICRIL